MYRHAYRDVRRHVYIRVDTQRKVVCLDTGIDMHVDTCMDMCIDVGTGMDMCMHM